MPTRVKNVSLNLRVKCFAGAKSLPINFTLNIKGKIRFLIISIILKFLRFYKGDEPDSDAKEKIRTHVGEWKTKEKQAWINQKKDFSKA